MYVKGNLSLICFIKINYSCRFDQLSSDLLEDLEKIKLLKTNNEHNND